MRTIYITQLIRIESFQAEVRAWFTKRSLIIFVRYSLLARYTNLDGYRQDRTQLPAITSIRVYMSPQIADLSIIVPATLTATAIAAAAARMATSYRSDLPPPYTERVPTTLGRTITSSDRSALKRIAEETLTAIRMGSYTYKGVKYDLTDTVKEAESKTLYYYSSDSSIKQWASSTKPDTSHSSPTHISILHHDITTLDAA